MPSHGSCSGDSIRSSVGARRLCKRYLLRLIPWWLSFSSPSTNTVFPLPLCPFSTEYGQSLLNEYEAIFPMGELKAIWFKREQVDDVLLGSLTTSSRGGPHASTTIFANRSQIIHYIKAVVLGYVSFSILTFMRTGWHSRRRGYVRISKLEREYQNPRSIVWLTIWMIPLRCPFISPSSSRRRKALALCNSLCNFFLFFFF